MEISEEEHTEIDSKKSLTDWANEPTIRDLKQDFEDAASDKDTHVSKVNGWLDNLNVTGSARISTPKGRSELVPKVIRKQAEWRYAALSEPFLSTEDIFNVSPVTFEDVKAAEQNQLVLNNQFNTKIDKIGFIDEYVRTAVDEGTVVVRVGWDFEEEEVTKQEPIVEYISNPDTAPMHNQLHMMMTEDPQKFNQEIPPQLQEAHRITMESGIPTEARVIGFEEVTELVTTKNQPTVEIVDYRNLTIDPSCLGNLDKAKFIVFSFETSLSDLEAAGKYTNLKEINIDNNSILGDPDHTSKDDSSFNFNDKPRKKFVAYEYWGFWDINNTGLIKPIVATWVGDVLIRLEEIPFPDKKLPFVKVQYLPVRKSNYGEPDGALLEDNQKIVGAVTRGMIDTMGRSANGQTGTRMDALDITNKRKFERGEDYEYNSTVDPRLAFHMHTYPEIPQSAQYMLNLQNNDAEGLTGVKAFATTGLTGEALGGTATGARGVLDAASKRELGILRRLKAGIVQIGYKVISMNSAWLDEEEVIRITNDEFVTVRKDDLAGKFDLKLDISTAEEDTAKAEELSFMLQTMGNSLPFELTQQLLVAQAKLRKMPKLAKDLENYKPQPDPIAQEKAQLELELLKAQIAKEYSIVKENEAEAALDFARTRQTSSDADLKDLDFVEQESGTKQERDLEKQGAQARANAQLELVKASLKTN